MKNILSPSKPPLKLSASIRPLPALFFITLLSCFFHGTLALNRSLIKNTASISGPSRSRPLTTNTLAVNNDLTNTLTKINNKQAAPTISYSSPQSYYVGKPITALAPVSSGVSVLAFSSTPIISGSGFKTPRGVATDAAGNVYVADLTSTTIQKIPAGGGDQVALGSGFNRPSGLAVDAAGNVYVADAGNNAIKKIPADGGPIVSVGFGYSAPAGVAVDAAGNIYVADFGNNKIKKIPAGDGTPVTIGAGFKTPTGVAVDAAGNVYVADNGNNAVKKISVNGNITPFGSSFNQPRGIATDAVGNVYVADSNNLVKKFSPAGGSMVTLGSGYKAPYGIAIDASGNIYIADAGNNAIKAINPLGGYFISSALPAGLNFSRSTGIISGTPKAASPVTVYTITAYNSAGSSSATVSLNVIDTAQSITLSYNSSQVFTARTTITPIVPTSSGVAFPSYNLPINVGSGFTQPQGVAVDTKGNIYITDAGNNAIKKIPAGGSNPTTVAAGFNAVKGIVVDPAGNVYACVNDGGNAVVKKISALSGVITTFGFGFSEATGVAVDGAGIVYVADSGNGNISKLPVNGGQPIVITNVPFPTGITVDAEGNLYITQKNTSSILKIPVIGGNQTIATGVNSAGGIEVDASGNLYVTDQINGTITEIPSETGTPITISSGFNSPNGITVDGAGIIFVADGGNNALKKIIPAGGYYINPPLVSGLKFSNVTGIISGTPTTGSRDIIYTITGYNSSGSASTFLDIEVKNPITLNYGNPQTYSTGTAIAPLIPTAIGVGPQGYRNPSLGTGFSSSFSLGFDGAGNLFVDDGGDIIKFPAGGGGFITIAPGAHIFKIGVDAAGNIYGIDGSSIKKIPAGGGSTVTVASGISNPTGLAVDAAGNVFFIEDGVETIFKIPAGSGNIVNFSQLSTTPTCIAIDAVGNIYTGVFSGGIEKTPADGSAHTQIAVTGISPSCIAADNSGNLFVKSMASPVGGLIGAFEEILTNGSHVDLGIINPGAVAIDTVGNVYLTDGDIKSIRPLGGYYLSRELPAGLIFSSVTGVISGTPTQASPAKNYTITAYNTTGNLQANATITVLSSNANLASLNLSNGTLTPAFLPDTTNYTAAITDTITSIKITPTASDPTAAIKLNGITIASGTASPDLPLVAGDNVFSIIVTAQSGASKTYKLTATRAAAFNSAAFSFQDQSFNTANLKKQLIIFPNPASKASTVYFKLNNFEKNTDVNIEVTTLQGKRIQINKYTTDEQGNVHVLLDNGRSIGNGIYIINVKSAAVQLFGKLIINNN